MEKVSVNLEKRSYEIFIGNNNFNLISEKITDYSTILVLSNTKVGQLYKEQLISEINHNKVYYFEIDDGEKHKNIDTAMKVYDFMIGNDFDRKSLIITLGGGVVCDLGGFVASTFMRGIDFIQVPTSLLAQVDASIGGKVAVNHPLGKNMIGSFYQPQMVLINVDTLNTLEHSEFLNGMVEIIKHAMIYDEQYFTFVENNYKEILRKKNDILIKLIKRSCEIKSEVVSIDEKEKGLRAILNYGHTFGHFLENITNYKKFKHGEAVAIGMNFAAQFSAHLGYLNEKIVNRQNSLLRNIGLNIDIPGFNFDRVLEILKHDKKNSLGVINFILPEKIGEVSIYKISDDSIENFYKSVEKYNVNGVIDIGTNTVRLFIAEKKGNNVGRKYERLLDITRLGEDVDKNRYLKNEAIDRTINALNEFRVTADNYGLKQIIGYATSATRDSENRETFIKRALDEANVKVETITGDIEGIFAFNGVLTDKYEKKVLVIDIGGGSTEFIFGEFQNIEFAKSLNIGSVRVKEKFFKDERYELNYEIAKEWIYSHLDNISEVKDKDFVLVGVAGTITTQVSVLEKMKKYNPNIIHRYELSIDDIEKNLNQFQTKSLDDRKKINGLAPKRADVIVSGTILLKTIMEYLEKDKIVVSENDILEGLILNIQD